MRVKLGIADHAWLDKRTAIAQTVDALGGEFKAAMRAGWMSYYTRKAYPDGAADGGHAIGQESLVLDECVLAAHGLVYLLVPSCGCASWPVFFNEYTSKSQF